MLSAIILGPNRERLQWISEICSAMGNLCVYKSLTAYPAPYELAKLLDIFNPEVVFIDVEAETAATLAKQIRNTYPKTAVIGYVHQITAEREAELAGAGINQTIVPPIEQGDFEKVLVKAVETQAGTVVDNVIAFVPAKAGSGATTAALHLAASLAQDWTQKVLLLEGDAQSGLIATLLGLDADPERSIIRALESSQLINESMWNGLLWKAHGFDLLPMPTIKVSEAPSRWEYLRLLSFLRPRYDLILVDLPELPNETTEALVNQAKMFYIVATPDKASLYLARRRIDELRFRAVPDARVMVLLNRWPPPQPAVPPPLPGAPPRPPAPPEKYASLEEIQEYLGHAVAATLPHEDACLRQTLPDYGLVDRSTKLGVEYYRFAARLAGQEPAAAPPPVAAPPQKTSWRALLPGRPLQPAPKSLAEIRKLASARK